MRRINLPMDLLRTFITVSDLGGYTKAGEALNRTQPAISLQMKRLETMLETKLLRQNGKVLELTSDGQNLAGYARQILRFNDEAIGHFFKRDDVGHTRIGLPTDYGLSFLQGVVTDFIKANGDPHVELHCDLSAVLLEKLRSDDLDLAVALTNDKLAPYLVRAWDEQPIWAGAKSGKSYQESALPLILHPEGCEYRNRAIEALYRAGRDWRISYVCPGIDGLQEAAAADLGVTVLTHKTLRDDMRILTEEDGMPDLTAIQIGLFYKHARLKDLGLSLAEYVIDRLDQAAEVESSS